MTIELKYLEEICVMNRYLYLTAQRASYNMYILYTKWHYEGMELYAKGHVLWHRVLSQSEIIAHVMHNYRRISEIIHGYRRNFGDNNYSRRS